MLVFRKNMEVRVESDQIRVVLGKGKGVFNVYPYETVIDKKPFNYGTLSVLTALDKTVTYCKPYQTVGEIGSFGKNRH